jgi:predicted GNAT family acetyltransferase
MGWIKSMAEIEYSELQRLHGGRYVAQRDGEVIASAGTYDELSQQLEKATVDWTEVLIEYVEPADVVCVY